MIKINKNIYNDHKYRWISYWHQINEVLNINPSSVLEVGPGSGIFSSYIKNKGILIQTLDIDSSTNPDIMSDVRKINLNDCQYDLVCAFQVLEHFPLEDLESVASEFYRISKKGVIISLPQNIFSFRLSFKLPLIKEKRFLLTIPKFKKIFLIREMVITGS